VTAGRLARTLYARASATRLLRRPLHAVRSHPRVRAFARRHVDVLLARGGTWANVDGALRLLAEDPLLRIAFGPWRGDPLTELLYWAPFVRWAGRRFSLDPSRVIVLSSGGVGHWYEGCGTYREDDAAPADAVRVTPDPVLALVERYRSGADAPRPLLKRAVHVPLPPPGDVSARRTGTRIAIVVDGPVGDAVAADREVLRIDRSAPIGAQHAQLRGVDGLVASWSGLALLGVLAGIPTLAVRAPGDGVQETDLDLASRVAARLGTSLTVLEAGDVRSLAAALAGSF